MNWGQMKTTFLTEIKNHFFPILIAGLITGAFTYFAFNRHYLVFIMGLLIGLQSYFYILLYVALLQPRVHQLNFSFVLLINTFFNVILIILAVFISIVIINRFNITLVFNNFKEVLMSRTILYGVIFGLALSFFFSSYNMFETLLGKNFLLKLFTGRYHTPFEEERIFMFLDLTSSTQIAEKLGHKKFLSLLNDFFYDLTEPVSVTHGEIYKYVGDQAIITWKMKKGLKNENPLRCFFLLQEKIEKNKSLYQKKYGVVPQFKAGLHGGTVVTGEMGFIKKEIAFLGDVLNTTSRMESSCNQFGKNLLVSDWLIEKMKPGEDFVVQPLGEISFRGKEKPVNISSVEIKKINLTP
jgi:adenylate cyclase